MPNKRKTQRAFSRVLRAPGARSSACRATPRAAGERACVARHVEFVSVLPNVCTRSFLTGAYPLAQPDHIAARTMGCGRRPWRSSPSRYTWRTRCSACQKARSLRCRYSIILLVASRVHNLSSHRALPFSRASRPRRTSSRRSSTSRACTSSTCRSSSASRSATTAWFTRRSARTCL